MRHSHFRRVACASLAAATLAVVHAQQPTFKTGVDLVRLDVTVVSDDGTPVRDLTADDFEITLNGQPRPVRSLQFINQADAGEPAAETPDFSTNTASTGRLTFVYVDENSLLQGQEKALVKALSTYLATMKPNDKTALFTHPGRTARVDFTSDVAVLGKAAEKIHGWSTELRAPTPIQIDRGESGPPTTFSDPNRNDYNPVTEDLRAVLNGLKGIDGPKSLVFVAGGLPGGPTNFSRYRELGQLAAAARTTIYAVRAELLGLDLDLSTGVNERPDGLLEGMDVLAGASGGARLSVVAGGLGVFARIQRETSGSYVVGVEPLAGAPPDKPLKIDVGVKRPGVIIRSPKQLVPAAHAAAKRDPKAAIGDILRQPRVSTDLPLRVATLSARQTGSDKLKTLIVAEVASVAGPGVTLTWGYEVRSGPKVVADGFETKPIAGEAAATEPLTTTASLAPGSYTLRFAVIDADGRRGSVDGTLNVALHEGIDVVCSDLFVGQAQSGKFAPRVTFGPETQQVVAFVEVYGDKLPNDVQVEFVLRDAEDVVKSSGRVAAAAGQGGKRIAQAAMRVSELRVGTYQLSAQVLVQGRPAAIVRRAIVIGV